MLGAISLDWRLFPLLVGAGCKESVVCLDNSGNDDA